MLLWPFNHYPGTDYETFNWEWVLATVKEWVATMQTFKYTITAAWEAMQEDWKEFIDSTYKDQITDILEDHPEWVTTVMDGAITEPKINAQFLTEIENVYATPQNYGALADGIHDDTAAIQAAINSGRNVFIPAGTYRTTAPLIINSGEVILTGDRKATIKPDSGVTKVIEVNGQNTPANRVRTIVRNVRIEGNDTCSGLYLTKGANINVYNVEILSCAVAVWCYDVLIYSLYQCDIHNNAKALYFEGFESVGPQNCVTVSECHFYGNTINVLDTPETLAHHLANVNFIACEIEGNGNGTKPLFNIYEGGSSANRVLTFYGCWFEANHNTRIIDWKTDDPNRSIAMYSNVMLSQASELQYGLETDNGTFIIIDQSDTTTYSSGAAINITGSGRVNAMGAGMGLPNSIIQNKTGLFIGNDNRNEGRRVIIHEIIVTVGHDSVA